MKLSSWNHSLMRRVVPGGSSFQKWAAADVLEREWGQGELGEKSQLLHQLLPEKAESSRFLSSNSKQCDLNLIFGIFVNRTMQISYTGQCSLWSCREVHICSALCSCLCQEFQLSQLGMQCVHYSRDQVLKQHCNVEWLLLFKRHSGFLLTDLCP